MEGEVGKWEREKEKTSEGRGSGRGKEKKREVRITGGSHTIINGKGLDNSLKFV